MINTGVACWEIIQKPKNGIRQRRGVNGGGGRITGCYLPTWCPLRLDDGRKVNALVFIIDTQHPLYEADSRAETIAPLIARASGPLGSNAQYLFSLEQAMKERGMRDDCLFELVHQVRDLLSYSPNAQ